MDARIAKRFDLTGKVALVTGGNKGLGFAMARGLAQAGADVFISSRKHDELRAALPEILNGTRSKGGFYPADMTKRAQVQALAAAAVQQMGKVDILVNNAGINQPQPIDAVDDEVWDRIIETNVTSVMALTRALVPGMCERKWGRVIHISSIMGFVSKGRRTAYSASKSAVLGMVRAAALDLGETGVTVNCLAPGPFLTDMPKASLTDAERAPFAARTAMNRWGDPEELVGPLLLLASDAGSYITGQSIVVDGGFLAG